MQPSRISFYLCALAIAVPALAAAALPPAGQRYKLTVKTSFEAPFSDCFTFSTAGTFIHSPQLHNFPYQLNNLNTQQGTWQAIWVGRVSIAFSGTADGTTITGNAVDALARTYSITGSRVQSCSNEDQVLQGGWATK